METVPCCHGDLFSCCVCQMLIDLTDKVVIVDEAHNIEDSAREAASLSVTNYQLEEVSSELQDVSECLTSSFYGRVQVLKKIFFQA